MPVKQYVGCRGKSHYRITLRIPMEFAEIINAKALGLGTSRGEYLRDLIYREFGFNGKTNFYSKKDKQADAAPVAKKKVSAKKSGVAK